MPGIYNTRGIYGLLYENSKKYADKAFVLGVEHMWTYSEVEALSRIVSAYLLRNGVEKGDRVVIFCDNSIQYIAAFFGILRINAVAVPVNPSKLADSVVYIVKKCSPKLILACCKTLSKLDRIEDKLGVDIINVDSCNLWDDPDLPDCFDMSDELHVDENDNAMILFTSGTTAYPKGVTLTHANLMANTEAIVEYLHLSCDDSVLMTLPFTYSYGNSVLLTHVYAGASIVIENNVTYPYKILESIKRYGVTGFSTIGSYIGLILKYIKNSDIDESFFEGLRYITFAGESTSNDDIRFITENYPDVLVYVMYGQTESAARLSYLEPSLINVKPGSIGKGLCNVELKVINEFGDCIKPGQTGEIIARGPSIMKGYWDDPEATKEVLKDGWLFTGDYATVDEDGYIYVKGRRSDIIKHMGHRISPVEIENVINSISGVKESAVVGTTIDGVPVIKAFIVPQTGSDLMDIEKHLFSRLPIYMRPRIFEIIEHLPRTDTGKIMRSLLRVEKCVE